MPPQEDPPCAVCEDVGFVLRSREACDGTQVIEMARCPGCGRYEHIVWSGAWEDW